MTPTRMFEFNEDQLASIADAVLDKLENIDTCEDCRQELEGLHLGMIQVLADMELEKAEEELVRLHGED